MNTAKHTPVRLKCVAAEFGEHGTDNEGLVAFWVRMEEPRLCKADANLIGGAWDLLENLKDAVRFLDALETKLGHAAFVDAMPNNCHGRNDMRTAISEAEGGGQ